MRRSHRFLNSIILLFVFSLTGCHLLVKTQKPTQVTPLHITSAGYRCVVTNSQPSGGSAAAWSADKKQAQSQAMKACRAQSRYPNACQAQKCRGYRQKPVHATLPWYTCYVENKQRPGLWRDTSHDRFRATSGAFSRCRKNGKAENCYLKYCRVW